MTIKKSQIEQMKLIFSGEKICCLRAKKLRTHYKFLVFSFSLPVVVAAVVAAVEVFVAAIAVVVAIEPDLVAAVGRTPSQPQYRQVEVAHCFRSLDSSRQSGCMVHRLDYCHRRGHLGRRAS